ncbi:MAG: SH3 domain-containing protein [Thalassobaculum sp.]|uniref:SH3 domain-containing protein n=1 Tax=Thalassobaculum sp. TaxID=2022740 RepID=UPI0032ED61A4
MRKTFVPILIAGALIAQPVAAQEFLKNITNEDIGRVLGGVGGALVGSQFGGGSGKLVAVAAGAIGGMFLGGVIGKQLDPSDRQGIAETRQQALDTGQPVTWNNPDSGVQSTARVVETSYRPVPAERSTDSEDLVWRVPPLQLIGGDYVATTTSNVRGGPGTEYGVMDQLKDGEPVYVVGKVVEADWMMVARNGIGRGFVHADLLRPADVATRVDRPLSNANLAGVRECSILEQEVRLADGTSETKRARACRSADGSWELV